MATKQPTSVRPEKVRDKAGKRDLSAHAESRAVPNKSAIERLTPEENIFKHVFGSTKEEFPGEATEPASEIDDAPGVSREATLAAKLLGSIEEAGDSDIAELCDKYGLKRSDLGRLTGFSLRALAAWSAGELPSEPARRRLHEIRRLLDALAELVKANAIPKWLGTPNKMLNNMTPLQVIEVGEIDRLWQMVYQLQSGNPD
jgi:hypothetical protein